MLRIFFGLAPRLLPNQNQVYSVAKGMSSQNFAQIRRLFGHNFVSPLEIANVLRNDHYSIADDPLFTIEIDLPRERMDHYAFPNRTFLSMIAPSTSQSGLIPVGMEEGRFPGS